MTKKRCRSCDKRLPLDSFHKKSGSVDGLQSWCKKCRYNGSQRKAVPEAKAFRAKNALPVEPFREWLLATIPKYESMLTFAEMVGVPERTIRRILNENKTVQLNVVDHILIHEGGTMLWELYPDG